MMMRGLSLLLLAWGQTPAATGATSCFESQAQLARASAVVESLEAQLNDARQVVLAKEREVRSVCESWVTRGRAVDGRIERSARRTTAQKAAIGCDYSLSFQRITDYALPRSVEPWW
jgi:hypothetical protein